MRIELIHPMIIHFPLALLLIGSACRLAAYLLRKGRFAKISLTVAWILLTLGIVFAWLAIMAGELAAERVQSGLCDPTIFQNHQTCAYTAAILFSSGIVIDWFHSWKKQRWIPPLLLSITTTLLYAVASILLIFAGFYGGNLVYDQGAAVKKICPTNS